MFGHQQLEERPVLSIVQMQLGQLALHLRREPLKTLERDLLVVREEHTGRLRAEGPGDWVGPAGFEGAGRHLRRNASAALAAP